MNIIDFFYICQLAPALTLPRTAIYFFNNMAVLSPEIGPSQIDSKIHALLVGGLVTASLIFSQTDKSPDNILPQAPIEQTTPEVTPTITTDTRASVKQYEQIFGCEIQSRLKPDTTGKHWANGKEQNCAKYIASVIGKNTYGWGPRQQKALVELWTHESNWSANADNPFSSAYGIPQAMTSNKLHGPDIKTTFGRGPYSYYRNPVSQIQWGIDYIHERYGAPIAANKFWKRQCGSSLGCWY